MRVRRSHHRLLRQIPRLPMEIAGHDELPIGAPTLQLDLRRIDLDALRQTRSGDDVLTAANRQRACAGGAAPADAAR